MAVVTMVSFRRQWVIAALLGSGIWISAICLPPSATAQDTDPGSSRQATPAASDPAAQDAAVNKVREAYEAGYKAMLDGHLDAAQTDFETVVKLAPTLAEGHNALGSVLLARGEARPAASQFEKALALKPLHSAMENLGRAYAALQENKPAETQFERAAAQSPLTVESAMIYARLLDGDGKPADAAAILRQTIDETPTQAAGASKAEQAELASLHDALGTLEAEQEHWDIAQKQFETALSLSTDALAPQIHMGVLLLRQKRPDAALPYLEAATALAPEDAQAHLLLGQTYAALQRDPDALRELERAVVLAEKPGTSPLLVTEADYQLALQLQNTARPGDAIPYFERVVKARPKDAAALTNLGLALMQTGKSKEGMPYFQRALALTPDDPTLRTDVGDAYLQLNDLDDAVKQFNAGLAKAPDNAELHYDLGLGLKLEDKLPEAITELQRAAALRPDLADPHLTLGTIYMQQGKFDLAAQEMEHVLAAQPDNGDLWATLGSVYKQAGKPDDAVAALKKAIDLLPNQPGPHTTLASVLQEKGNTEEAAAERKIAGSLTRGAMNRQAALFATNAGDLLLSKGALDDAIAQYRTAIKDDATYIPAHRQLALALDQKGMKAEAAAERKIVDASPPDASKD
jgi:protein O-GlcNAc transferase